ncbi:MFS transporter [Cryptosporangium minutisporangium]|uniref:MFS transporter n=1 Tax=Cryptosporangium minutisporangium TaxID=113569 RepID=UPI0031EE533D
MQHSLRLTDGELGLALFGVAAGSVPALLLTARLLRSLRSGAVSVVTALIFGGSLPLIGAAGDAGQLTAVLVVLGAASGVLDVAMNTSAVIHQQRTGRRVLSRLHGGYSLGVLAGAGGGVVAAQVGATVTEHLTAAAVLLVAAALTTAPLLWPTGRPTTVARQPANVERPPANVRRAARIPLTTALLAVCGLFVEGLVLDWSALLVVRDLGGSRSSAATGLALFSLAMFMSRTAGDAALHRFGERRVLTVGAVVLGTLTPVACFAGQPVGMVVAIGACGLALGPVFPLAVHRAGRSDPARTAVMAARVSAVGYLAYLTGPPAVGLLADTVGLPVTFAAATLVSCAGILCSRRAARETVGAEP